MAREPRPTAKLSSFRQAVRLVHRICDIAAAPSLIDDCRVDLARRGVIVAVQRRHTPVIFDWLMDLLSYQGISDSIAFDYMVRHGPVRWHDIAKALAVIPSCPKL